MIELFRLLKPYVIKNKKPFIILNLSVLLSATVETLIPLKISDIIDQNLKKTNEAGLYIGFVVLVGFIIIDLLMNMIMRFSSNRFSQGIMYDIRHDLFETLQFQELEFYSKETVGQIMARSINEVFSMRELLSWSYRIAALLVVLFIASIIAMFQTSIPLSATFLILPLILFIIVRNSSNKNQKVFYNARYVYGEMEDVLAENLSGIKTVKSFGRENEQIQTFNVKNQEFFDASMKTAKVRAVLSPGAIFVISLGLIMLIFVGGYLVFERLITPGKFIAFMLLVLNVTVPGRFIGYVGITAQDANSAAIRLNEIFFAPKLIPEVEEPHSFDSIKGQITFENVTFEYPGSHHTLHNINLKIPAGQKVALLGTTGSGKSTLINLIPRFFDPKEGRILIDGIDIKTVSLSSLRSHISIVHQDSYLFTLSVHDNIAFGKPDATREEVIKAAKIAQIHDYIMKLDDGYETIVGERGVTLSGGQRQRVTIARALLKDPKILIFDDSVSAVDPETEARIQESLDSAAKERTTIVISQRPSSLRYVDRIIVLDNGRIAQDGSHEELEKVDGIYRDFITAVETQVKFMNWHVDDDGNVISVQE